MRYSVRYIVHISLCTLGRAGLLEIVIRISTDAKTPYAAGSSVGSFQG